MKINFGSNWEYDNGFQFSLFFFEYLKYMDNSKWIHIIFFNCSITLEWGKRSHEKET